MRISPRAIALSAAARFTAFPLFGWFNEQFELNSWISVLFLPAGVVLIALLLAGQSAAIGLALGTFGWNLVSGKTDIVQNLVVSLAVWGSAALACWLFVAWRHRRGRPGPGERPWTGYRLVEIAGFSAVLAILSPAFHHVAFFATGEEYGIGSYLAMAMGDFTGAMLLFVALNLTTSVLIHLRALRMRSNGFQ